MLKEKLINVKNILRIIISTLIIMSMVKSCSMAFSSKNEMRSDLSNKLDILIDKGVLPSTFNKTDALTIPTTSTDYINYFIGISNGLEYHNSNSNYTSTGQLVIGYVVYNCVNGNAYQGSNLTWESYKSGINSGSKLSFSVKFFNINDGTNTVQVSSYRVKLNSNWYSWLYTSIDINTTSVKLNAGEETGGNYINQPPFNFVFYDTSVTATAPNGETAYCVFLDPIQNYQKIGYVEDFENHRNTQIYIFSQNYRDPDNVLVNSIGESNYILNESGELLVNTNTMWSALIYEITGLDNGPSGDFLNGQSFTTYYYIGAGSNVSGDPNFYGADYNNNQFFLWKLLGNFGDGSGDPGSGLFGGLGNLFSGIYDKMFKVESGDILKALEHVKETNKITDMELYSGDLEILNILDGEPDDFIISWNNINYQNETIIPSGDINFSQKIRENQTLQDVMNWVHVILGFSLITIIIQEYWFTFLKILGVGVSVYEDNQEERERLEEVYGTHVYDTQVTTRDRNGNEILGKSYRTYRKRRK